ncbi:hypothetical protein T492DRAFT_832389 [Pavlovales sp. CCMP2436]|nr:hypothetical protein T492DRAFT_832389 [Pavlovales sp. CCMP2436]
MGGGEPPLDEESAVDNGMPTDPPVLPAAPTDEPLTEQPAAAGGGGGGAVAESLAMLRAEPVGPGGHDGPACLDRSTASDVGPWGLQGSLAVLRSEPPDLQDNASPYFDTLQETGGAAGGWQMRPLTSRRAPAVLPAEPPDFPPPADSNTAVLAPSRVEHARLPASYRATRRARAGSTARALCAAAHATSRRARAGRDTEQAADA